MNVPQSEKLWELIDRYAEMVKNGDPPALLADAAQAIERYADWHACAKDALASIQNCCRMALRGRADKTEMLREIDHIAKQAWEDE